MPTKAKPITRKPVLIDLALQGGGSHGARIKKPAYLLILSEA